MINTVVGSGTLVTFPVLLALGYPPLTPNVSNGLGLVPGSLTGAIGYRRELTGLGGRVARLAVASVFGALLGAVLLVLPPGAFDAVVPVRVGVAVVLVIIQPLLARRLAGRRGAGRTRVGPALLAGVFGAGVYGATSAPRRACYCWRCSASASTTTSSGTTPSRTSSRPWRTSSPDWSSPSPRRCRGRWWC